MPSETNDQDRGVATFTYHEDVLPSRIDFGKHKYGEPFITEQVEDVKTFFKIMAVILIGCVLTAMRLDNHKFDLEMYLTKAYYVDEFTE